MSSKGGHFFIRNMNKKVIFKNKVIRSWLWVSIWSIAIFLTVRFARRIQRFVYNEWGREVFGYFVLAALFIATLCLVCYLFFKQNVRTISNYLWLIVIGVLYVYFTLQLWKIPEEAVHFLEYGLLSFFLFRALSHNVKDKSIYITATLFALLIGTADEILQWIIPQRFWDFRDVGLNGLSGGLFQLAIWKVVRPKFISEKINLESLHIFTVIFSCCLLLLGLCASNTPSRVYAYTKRIPFLSFLQKEEPMSEFGYKYKDQEIGVFYSRLNPNQLRSFDKKKGEEYAATLNGKSNVDYEQFIKDYNQINNPFLHEIRVHIFRRDTYYERGNNSSDHNEKRESYFIAYKENLILERYFTQSIKNSVYSWDEDMIKDAISLIEINNFYKSPVSAGLFTTFSEKTMWISVLMTLMGLVLFNFYYHRRENIKPDS
jgi:hypothetical protein